MLSIIRKIFALMLLAVSLIEIALPCSMYKITANGKTMVGNNEDSWGRDARIWFVPKTKDKLAVVCVGYARKKSQADGAMNEAGLVFDAFTMAHKANMPEKDPKKQDFSYATLKTIMQQCKTVEEVYALLDKLNLHILNGSPIFNGGMLLFVDKTGRYLVVEANKMTLGNDDKFALANFSFADTKDLRTIKAERYCKGVTFLNNKPLQASLPFCAALSDTMSVSRAKVGDGTLYTSIYDLEKGFIHLYFYHDFGKCVTFDLQEECAKGEHTYNMAELFPRNQQYEQFIAYQTPQNNKAIFSFVAFCGLLFFFSAAFFLGQFFRRANTQDRKLKISLFIINNIFGFYAVVLLRNEGIFYFPAPYQDKHSLVVSLASYVPFVMLAGIVPLLIILKNIIVKRKWRFFATSLFALNNVAYLVLLGLFAYWGLFSVFA